MMWERVTMWERVRCFIKVQPLLSSVLVFFVGIVIGGLLLLVWRPLVEGYVVALIGLFLVYELRKRVLVDRQSLVWVPSLIALGFILLWPIGTDHRAILFCSWIVGNMFILKLRRRSRDRARSERMTT